MATTLKLHDKIYYEDTWANDIIEAEIVAIGIKTVEIHDLWHINKNGKRNEKSYGVRQLLIDDVYTSYEEAYNARNEKASKAVKAYCDAINSVEDLVRFPLQHCLNGEEYTDYNALKAYKIRAHELLGVEL